jgi:hypothetical protein
MQSEEEDEEDVDEEAKEEEEECKEVESIVQLFWLVKENVVSLRT